MSERHRKALALRAATVHTPKPVLRLMRRTNLLAPTRATVVLGSRTQGDTITIERLHLMCGWRGRRAHRQDGEERAAPAG